MATSTEYTLPTYNQSELAEEAAKLIVLSGELLQTKVVDIQSEFSVRGNNESIYLDTERQVQDIQPLKLGAMTRFIFKKPDFLGDSAECSKITMHSDSGLYEIRESLVLDEKRLKVRVTEEKEAHDSEYVQTGLRSASVRTILSMAKEATANADPRQALDGEEPYKKGWGTGEYLVLYQPDFIPILGKLAVVAGDFVLNRAPDTSLDAKVKIKACHYRMYGSMSSFDRISNSVEFWGVNRATQIGAAFKCEAYPLSSSDISVVRSNLVIDDRSHENGAHLTKDTMVLNGNLRRRRRTRIASEGPRAVGEYPANLDTIVKLAETAVQLVRGEE